jgi:hypothetical protein
MPLPSPTRSRAAQPVRRPARPAVIAPEPLHVDGEFAPGRRRAGGAAPEDRAFYACGCGYAFTADVAAGVRCPHCSAEQPW